MARGEKTIALNFWACRPFFLTVAGNFDCIELNINITQKCISIVKLKAVGKVRVDVLLTFSYCLCYGGKNKRMYDCVISIEIK